MVWQGQKLGGRGREKNSAPADRSQNIFEVSLKYLTCKYWVLGTYKNLSLLVCSFDDFLNVCYLDSEGI